MQIATCPARLSQPWCTQYWLRQGDCLKRTLPFLMLIYESPKAPLICSSRLWFKSKTPTIWLPCLILNWLAGAVVHKCWNIQTTLIMPSKIISQSPANGMECWLRGFFLRLRLDFRNILLSSDIGPCHALSHCGTGDDFIVWFNHYKVFNTHVFSNFGTQSGFCNKNGFRGHIR